MSKSIELLQGLLDNEEGAIALQRVREYCNRILSDRQTMGVSSDHEAGYLSGQESVCEIILEILNGEYE